MGSRTLMDENVLIAASDAQHVHYARAQTVLADPSRVPVCTPLIRLECLPARGTQDIQRVLREIRDWIPITDATFRRAEKIREAANLRPIDAIHAATALLYDLELASSERPNSPYRRVEGLRLASLEV